jgi:GNAT superfamily N-acetyltransferase
MMVMKEGLRLVFDPDPARSDEAALREALGQWNVRVTGFSDYAPAYHFLREADGRIRGGILAYVWGKWLHVDILWLEEELRRQGWGTKLMEAAHAIGREKGAEAAWLDTFSFQARPFYERLGYELVFEVPGFPPGHSRYFMCKRPL